MISQYICYKCSVFTLSQVSATSFLHLVYKMTFSVRGEKTGGC